MSWNISVDVGGTFTDIVLDQDGLRRFYKSLSNHDDIAKGIMEGLEYVSAERGIETRTLLESCHVFSCGTTAATNAILEGRTARTALLCTAGFRDILRVREGGRENSYDIYEEFPEPLVPRHLTFAITERVNAEGGIELALDEDNARTVLNEMAGHQPDAIAVALLWSVMNPAHELRLGAMIEEILPGVPYSLSHQVNPTIGEYKRSSATALDASLKPIMRHSVSDLARRLELAGYSRRPLFVCSNGGRTSSDNIIARPVFLCLSGPAAAPGAAVQLAEQAGIANRNIISIDLGGTSLDICTAIDGSITMQRQGTIAGHVFGVPSVDIHTIASGGGSIARTDAGGFVHVGPKSAGSRPGPACYGLGGTAPTLTDANLLRGLINAEHFGGGHLRLDEGLAGKAVQDEIAGPLGISVLEAAALISAVAEQNMIAAIEDMTMRKGHDPRDFVLVSGGAAGGLHAATLARELGIRQVLIPRAGSVLSAYGISTGEIKFDFGMIGYTKSDDFDFAKINAILRTLHRDGEAFLDGMEIASSKRLHNVSVDARYTGQVWQISVPLNVEQIDGRDQVEAITAAFHELHEQLYSVSSPGERIEFLEWRLQAVGLVDPPEQTTERTCVDAKNILAETQRRVYLRELGGEAEIPVYKAAILAPGFVLEGPALVEDELSSSLIPDKAKAEVTTEGGLLIDLG